MPSNIDYSNCKQWDNYRQPKWVLCILGQSLQDKEVKRVKKNQSRFKNCLFRAQLQSHKSVLTKCVDIKQIDGETKIQETKSIMCIVQTLGFIGLNDATGSQRNMKFLVGSTIQSTFEDWITKLHCMFVQLSARMVISSTS